MIIKSTRFTGSYPKLSIIPAPDKPEFAFIGRSNVGKSSLINMITGKPKLAKTSQTPGKTKLANYFLINENWNLVDLPGYGFAKVSKESRQKFGNLIEDYLLKRETLVCVFVLVDSRLEPQKIDMEFINWVGEKQIPFCIVYTKTDKQSKTMTAKNISFIEKELKKTWEELPTRFSTSAVSKEGKAEILEFIEGVLKNL